MSLVELDGTKDKLTAELSAHLCRPPLGGVAKVKEVEADRLNGLVHGNHAVHHPVNARSVTCVRKQAVAQTELI